jgi:hypothetical protein
MLPPVDMSPCRGAAAAAAAAAAGASAGAGDHACKGTMPGWQLQLSSAMLGQIKLADYQVAVITFQARSLQVPAS